MTPLFSKFAFVHRRLWRDDPLYRASLLCGPVPLVGFLLAVFLWMGMSALTYRDHRPTAWAIPRGPRTVTAVSAQPKKVEPVRPLPLAGPNGLLTGYENGWEVTAHPIQISPNLDVDVKPKVLGVFPATAATIGMADILAKGPPSSLFVALGSGFLAVRTAGNYALSARIERSDPEPADCLVRLAFGPGRIVSTHEVGLVGDVAKTFDAAWFELQPGLYPIGWAFGCWRDHQAAGPGQITLLIAHPGDASLLPVRSDDVVRPKGDKP